MRRSFFFAVGLFVFLIGAQFLAVDKFVFKSRLPPPQKSQWFGSNEPKLGPNREFATPEWGPWTFMSTGAVIALYSFTIYKGAPTK